MADNRILIVEDDETLAEVLRFNLEAEGFDAVVAHSAEEALLLPLSSFSLILLDIMMGRISGTDFARILKNNPATASIPVIFCTARDAEDDMVEGLDLGADDYITKPYSLRNVLTRVRTVLRRASRTPAPLPPSDTVSFEGLTLVESSKQCFVDGQEVRLPRKEYEILKTLVSHPGRIFSREELLHEVWPDEVVVLDRVVDVNITRIRHKVGRYGSHIITRSGYGYGFMV